MCDAEQNNQKDERKAAECAVIAGALPYVEVLRYYPLVNAIRHGLTERERFRMAHAAAVAAIVDRLDGYMNNPEFDCWGFGGGMWTTKQQRGSMDSTRRCGRLSAAGMCKHSRTRPNVRTI